MFGYLAVVPEAWIKHAGPPDARELTLSSAETTVGSPPRDFRRVSRLWPDVGPTSGIGVPGPMANLICGFFEI